MILKIFTIHDSKAGAFLPPFYLPQQGMAIRTFGDCVNDGKHEFSKHPEDYTLFLLGTFDDNTAKTKAKTPESIGNGLEFLVDEGDPRQGDLIDQDFMDVKNKDLPQKVGSNSEDKRT